MKTSILVAIATLVAGCATVPSNIPAVPVPVCSAPEDCNAKWDAAQIFVVKHSNMKVQIATNVLIETYSPPQYGTEIAMRVTKEPLGAGSYQFVAEAWCNNMFGCGRHPQQIVADFNSYVNAAYP